MIIQVAIARVRETPASDSLSDTARAAAAYTRPRAPTTQPISLYLITV